jgi:hypothetical protein
MESKMLAYFSYLDRLSKLGVANMRAAGVYLEGRFIIEPDEAKEIIDAWFAGFGSKQEQPPTKQ